MWNIFESGGYVMYPILICSILSLGIILERFWRLQRGRVIPKGLVIRVWEWLKNNELDKTKLEQLRKGSPLGRLLASGLAQRNSSREVIKESIEETGGHVVHELECCLPILGTVAAVAPLLGLLGTVLGIMDMFGVAAKQGMADPSALASGISVALITTAAGLIVAIPALIFHRVLTSKVDALVVEMEQEALKMVEILQGFRVREDNNKENNL
jgi:biopolymer transport protein ExbB